MPRIESWIIAIGVTPEVAPLATRLIGLVILIALAGIANWVAKRVILRAINAIAARTPTDWDNRLADNGFFTRLSHVAPAIVIQKLAPVFFEGADGWISVAGVAVSAYIVVIGLLVFHAIVDTVESALDERDLSSRVPVKGFSQAVKLVSTLIGFIVLLSVLFDRSPLYFFSGLGALTAVLLLVFKDAILGLVAGVQLSVNNMIRKGDWIEMPKHAADGDVVDVTLTTIKVQNWDRTITTIPTYALISEAFKNWRVMAESGGRRIKRSLNIDLQTVKFVDSELLARLQRIQILRPYLDERAMQIAAWNAENGIDETELVNGRRMTNLGCFRAYCAAYLHKHPLIHRDMTFLVRHLQPTSEGIPMEVYVFVTDTRWAAYEEVQADIVDHLIAALPHFDLRLYQKPSGLDLASVQVIAK